jgi:hypothetical protein
VTVSNRQRKALNTNRSRSRNRGVVRVEVQVPAVDVQIVHDLAAILRGEPDVAQAMRVQLRSVVAKPRTASIFGIFGSDLPDAYFEGVFEQGCRRDPPRDVEL